MNYISLTIFFIKSMFKVCNRALSSLLKPTNDHRNNTTHIFIAIVSNHIKTLFIFALITGGFEGFHSTVDPEELFRKIFGDAGFRMGGFNNQADFADSNFGFAAASEVTVRSLF